jgi:hypothetical protein
MRKKRRRKLKAKMEKLRKVKKKHHQNHPQRSLKLELSKLLEITLMQLLPRK